MVATSKNVIFPDHNHLLTTNCVVAHGRVVTSSRQITEVKQRRARLVLGWVTAHCSSHVQAMCRGVGQASHITLPLSTYSSDGYLVERES